MITYSTPISNLSSLGYGPPSPQYLSCFFHHTPSSSETGN